MSEQITVTLPDGSTESTRRARRRPRSRRRSARPREGGDRREGRRRVGRPRSARSTTTRSSRSSSPDSDDGREVLRHSTAHVMAEAVTRLFPGAKYTIGPAIADGFYYDFDLPDGADVQRRRPRQIEDEMRAIVKRRPAVRARRADLRRRARAVRRPAVQAGDHREGPHRCRRRGGRGRGRRRQRASPCTATSSTAHVEFVDLCRGPHVPSHRPPRRVQADEGRGRVLARQREGPDAPAHLRHRVGVAERARRVPAPARGSRDAAITASSAPSSTCSRSPRRSARGSRCSTRRAGSSAGSWRSTRGSGTKRRGYEFVNSPHITKEDLFQTSGHLEWFADGMFPPMHLDEWAARRASTTTSSR